MVGGSAYEGQVAGFPFESVEAVADGAVSVPGFGGGAAGGADPGGIGLRGAAAAQPAAMGVVVGIFTDLDFGHEFAGLHGFRQGEGFFHFAAGFGPVACA